MTNEPSSEEVAPLSSDDMVRAASVVVTSLSMVVMELRDEVQTLKKYGQRSRIIMGIAILLSLGLSYGLWQGHLNDQKTTRIQDSIVATQLEGCKFSNESRASQKRLWDGVFASVLPPPADETAERRKARLEGTALIKGLVEEAYAPRDCVLK